MTDDFKKGVLAAAAVASAYDACSTHRYRLEDCIAGKLNVGRAKPRRNDRHLPSPADSWLCGCAVALAEMHRLLIGGNNSSGVVGVARAAGLTIARAKAAGVDAYDWKELRRAGVK